MRLIDADAYLDYIDNALIKTHTSNIGVLALHRLVDMQETVDAVPVVRCKDCRFRYTLFCGMQHYENDDDFRLYMSDDWTNDDGFCYWGERKDKNV